MNSLTPEVLRVVQSYMTGLDCARSLTVEILVRYGEWDQLVKLKADPRNFIDAVTYHRWALATDFLRKCQDIPTTVDRKADTLEKWLACERQCFKTNSRFLELTDTGSFIQDVDSRIYEFLVDVKRMMQWLIGSSPDYTSDGAFGPGATISDRSGQTTVLHKLSSVPTFTPDAIGYLVPWSGSKWATACATRCDVPSSVRGNIYFSVPKTALVDRPCAKEASINAYFQRGLGLQLKRRLERRGFDLEGAQMAHQAAAQRASVDDSFCTIDLSSASDTVSRALVKHVTPHRWFQELSALASTHTRVNGKWHRLEKFSSMGNGFTFELETALFASICLAVAPWLTPGKDLWVFGDDIIVPTEVGETVLAALKFCGFLANVDKTFLSGNFKESCGGDYFDGYPVRGFFLESLPNEPHEWISAANGIRRCCSTTGLFNGVRSAWFACLDNIPSDVRRCRGPEALGDICIHDNQQFWSTRSRSSIRWIRVYRPAQYRGTDWERFDADVQLAGALYGVRLTRLQRNGRPGFTRFDPTAEVFRHKGREYVLGREAVLSYKVGWSPYS